jgi:alpha-tubulin suppressor-like RCC1 family protein
MKWSAGSGLGLLCLGAWAVACGSTSNGEGGSGGAVASGANAGNGGAAAGRGGASSGSTAAGGDDAAGSADTSPSGGRAMGGAAAVGSGGDTTTPSGGAAGASDEPSVTGISKVLAGEYQTFFLRQGRLYGLAGTSYRLGAGSASGPQFPPREVAFASDLKIVDGASGLHRTIATDQAGHVWEWGDIDWNPDLAKSNVPLQLTKDSAGKAFTLLDASGHNVRSMAAGSNVSVAVKGDGTVWVWDDCTAGIQGDGTDGSTTFSPINVPISLPDGVSIDKVVISSVALAGSEFIVALASDGSVWSWGGGGNIDNLGTANAEYQRPHQVQLTSTNVALPAIVDISSGSNFALALTATGELYAWGQYAHLTGACPGSSWCPAAKPLLITHVVTDGQSGGAHISAIAASSGANYAVMSDGSLWAWGSNAQGLVGNGVETDFANSVPPYTFDFSLTSLWVNQAVRIAPAVSNFSAVFSGSADVFYAYALTRDGRLFSWGRDKTADLGSGVYPLNSQQAAAYPNSWDVTKPTEVSPFIATDTPTSSPYCTLNPTAANCWCGAGPSSPQGC